LIRRKFNEIKTVDYLAELYLENKAKKLKTVHILLHMYRKEIKPHIAHV
jgi:hypothetical protein